MVKEHLKAGVAVVKRLVDAGHTAYFAGGWVRDFQMKIPSDDIDIATSASPQEVASLFEKTIPVGINFGVMIVVHDEHPFEVATFRIDRDYVDGRRPIGVDPATPEEDAKRRDFTINGMFYDPLDELLYDFVDGKNDIAEGIIRAIGNPEMRFAEDRLRMMRAVRYAARFHFVIEHTTLQAIAQHAPELLNAVAIERIWQEFDKMARFPHFEIALITMHRLGLLQIIFPELSALTIEDMEERTHYMVHFPVGTPTIVYLLELFPHFTSDDITSLCDRFKVSNKIKTFALTYNAHVKRFYIGTQSDDYQWAKTYSDPFFEISFQITALKKPPQDQATFIKTHEERQARLQKDIERLREQKPILRAHDLEKAGIAPGKSMGLLLQEGEQLSINEKLSSPDAIIEKLHASSNWPKEES